MYLTGVEDLPLCSSSFSCKAKDVISILAHVDMDIANAAGATFLQNDPDRRAFGCSVLIFISPHTHSRMTQWGLRWYSRLYGMNVIRHGHDLPHSSSEGVQWSLQPSSTLHGRASSATFLYPLQRPWSLCRASQQPCDSIVFMLRLSRCIRGRAGFIIKVT